MRFEARRNLSLTTFCLRKTSKYLQMEISVIERMQPHGAKAMDFLCNEIGAAN